MSAATRQPFGQPLRRVAVVLESYGLPQAAMSLLVSYMR